MSEPFIAEIRIFAGNFAPRGWALCDGQLLPISQNTAFFSLVGTIYGGDGRTTLGIPNLQGAMPMHAGRGPGLTSRPLGQRGGAASETLSDAHIPPHNHGVASVEARVPTVSATANHGFEGGSVAKTPESKRYKNATPNQNMQSGSVEFDVATVGSGSGSAHNNMSPYLAVTFIIALQGIYPSRS